ncbi:MAG: amidohydrolase family protein [Candidatus Methanoperedens sp.]|nr:amidohydrolase family protein [Candidatus Methanoperedens sp.]
MLSISFVSLIAGCVSPALNAQQPTASPAITTPTIKFEGRYIDVHTHITPNGMPIDQIIQNMDKEGIDRMVIMESPTDIYNGKPQSEFGIPDAAEKYPDRFIALYGGEALFMLYSVAAKGNYTKADEEKFSSLLDEAMKSRKYGGFGEVALRHYAAEDGTEITVPGDHPWMLIMSDIAAKYDVPIDIHMESEDESVAGLEKLLDHNKNTKIIWEHAGRSNTGKTTPQLMRQMMEKHPNLYSAVKIRKPKTAERIAVRILDENDKIMPEWMTLFRDFPDRFMVGSDIKPGEKEDEFNRIKDHRTFLKQLPPEVLKNIEKENAVRIYKINQT